MTQKSNHWFNIYLPLAVVLTLVVAACAKKDVDTFYPSTMFTPTSLTATGGDTVITFTWPASLYSSTRTVTYTLQISADSLFQTEPALSLEVDTNFRTVTDDSLQVRQKYFARVKANATDGAAESDWMQMEEGFTLIGEQIFYDIQSADLIDNAVILRWREATDITKIVITDADGMETEIPLDATDLTNQYKLIEGLTQNTLYSAEIFADTRSRGYLTFTTQATVAGDNVIDLRSITDRPEVLLDTLPQIASGSIVLLKRGLSYTVSSSYIFDRSVTIMSGLGFGDPAALMLAANFDASGSIDSLMFNDLLIVQDGASYFMNVSNATTIGKMNFESIQTQGVFNNSFIRLKTSGDLVSNLNINNCIIDSFGVGSKYAVIYANASSNAKFDNISITNSTFYSLYYFVRQDGVSATSLVINNCTFNDMINQSGSFINYSGSFPATFNIYNTILGKVNDPTKASGISSSSGVAFANTYTTSDCVFSSNALTGTTSYAGASTDLFTDPDNGDFTIKDGGFAGKSSAGDPRWRP